jgi:hypothetical protein
MPNLFRHPYTDPETPACRQAGVQGDGENTPQLAAGIIYLLYITSNSYKIV